MLAELADGVLRLGHREAVAGHDDDALGVRELDGRIVDADLAHRAAAVAVGVGLRALARRRSRRP